MEYKSPEVTASLDHIELLVELGLGVNRRLQAQQTPAGFEGATAPRGFVVVLGEPWLRCTPTPGKSWRPWQPKLWNSMEYLGLERLVEGIGIGRVIEQVGIERVIEQVGLE